MSARSLFVKCNRGGKRGRPTPLEMALRDAVQEWLDELKIKGEFSTADLGAYQADGLAEGKVRLLSTAMQAETEEPSVELAVHGPDGCHKVRLALLAADKAVFAKAVGLNGVLASPPSPVLTPSPPPAVTKQAASAKPKGEDVPAAPANKDVQPARTAATASPAVQPHFVLQRKESGPQAETTVRDQRPDRRESHVLIRREAGETDKPVLIRVHKTGQQSVLDRPDPEMTLVTLVDDWLHQAKQTGQFALVWTSDVRDYKHQRFQLTVDQIGKPSASRFLLAVEVGQGRYQRLWLECMTEDRAVDVCESLRRLQSGPPPRKLPATPPKPVRAVKPEAKDVPPLTFVRAADGTLRFLGPDRVFLTTAKGHPLLDMAGLVNKQLDLLGASGTFTLSRDGEADGVAPEGVSLAGGIEIRMPLLIKQPDGTVHRHWLTVSSFEQAAAIARLLSVQS